MKTQTQIVTSAVLHSMSKTDAEASIQSHQRPALRDIKSKDSEILLDKNKWPKIGRLLIKDFL